jgi:hypothetical protein
MVDTRRSSCGALETSTSIKERPLPNIGILVMQLTAWKIV